ncbi:NADH-ubiquinone oxidoreductase-F iron-sulfur binding region domain-containing protein [Thalassotalea fonticola]|uniref:NADH-quinone oxidoreductase subunit F n=1 Tax=Thalassotalea fonticola TaxID=3065649 RepID=A0ABZ0GP77_9GAMM|nr:NADH-ubiquinone oxidoreductase-F iron-sulfur binding region domain-containing protein [Colwelliaceae bacterium S1-1]
MNLSPSTENSMALMSRKIFVSLDTTARSKGSDKVATQAENILNSQPDLEAKLVRNGSRGMFWLEPLLEVNTPKGRVAYGPVKPEDVSEIINQQCFNDIVEHPLCLGFTEELPWFKSQQRLTFARVGIIDPIDVDDYINHGGFVGLTSALKKTAQQIVDEVKESGLRGRGGAAFPTGIKWQTVLDEPEQQKYIVCNADEGDSGTFADRMLMEGDPLVLIEGMIIAGLSVGANQGYIYLRSEYPQAQRILNLAIENAQAKGYLGENICGSKHSFHLEVRLGAGAYICGEETSLLESLEGKRGLVRAKPPLPAIEGLFGQPTVVNNVISLASVPYILSHGGASYRDFGMGRSRGTLPIQLAGNIAQGGLVELAFGISLNELLQQYGKGCKSKRPMRSVQVGGPLGAYLPEEQWHTALDYEEFASIGAVLGHGGIVVFDDTVDMAAQARFAMEFCEVESCGKCTPCRIGSVRGVEVIDKIIKNDNNEQIRQDNVNLLHDLCDTMEYGSLCAMGGMTPFPVRSALKYFPDDFLPQPSTEKAQ